MMGKSINPALYTWVVIKCITVEVAELRGVPLEGGASEGYSNVSFDKGSISESHQALKILHKEDDILIVHIFFYQYYLTFFVYSIEMGFEVAQIGLIPPFYCDF